MNQRVLRIAFVCLAVALIGGTLAVLWHTRPRSTAFLTDGESIRQPARGAPIRDILWQPASPLVTAAGGPGPVNSGDQEYEPRYTEDGQTLFFVRGKAGADRRGSSGEGTGGGADVYVSHRVREEWSPPRPLVAINTPDDELGPQPSADGRFLYFYSDRAGGLGGYDLWVSARAADAGDDPASGWQAPVNLGPAVNSPFNDYGAAISPDGSTLYFASNRPRPGEPAPDPGAWRATLREDLSKRTYDLYSAPLSPSDTAGQPPIPAAAAPLESLNTPFNEGACAVSPFGDFLYFASDRPGGRGGFDLYRARLRPGTSGPPTPDDPENLGEAINTAASELDPGLSMGGFALTFSSNRRTAPPATDARSVEPPDYNLYRSYAREVYRDTQTTRASMNWAAVVPWLLLLLLTLLLLLLLHLLKRFTQSSTYRQLSLLAKCLLTSLLVHAVLLLLFTFWYVGGAIEGVLRGGGSTKIALGLPSGGGGIVAQLRADLTSSPITTAALPSLRFAEPAATVNAQAAHFDAALAASQRPRSAVEAAPTPDAPAPDHPAARRLTIAISADAAPEPLDVATPSAPAPATTAEPAAPTEPTLARAPALQQSTVTPLPAGATTAPEFAPAAGAETSAPARSIAEPIAAATRDSRAPATPSRSHALSAPLAQSPANPDVALPQAGAPGSSATEPAAVIGAAVPRAAALPAPSAAAAQLGTQVRLPVSGNPPATGAGTAASLVSATPAESTDARPASAGTGRAPSPQSLGLPALAAAEVATPASSPSQGPAGQGEAQPAIGTIAAASPGAGPALPAAGPSTRAADIDVSSAAGSARTTPTTLADSPGAALADARPGPSASTRQAPAAGIPALAPSNAPQLALPGAGPTNATTQAEPQGTPGTAIGTAAAAGQTDRPALPGASAARAAGPATLDPRPSNPGPGSEHSLAGPAGRPADAPTSPAATGHGPRKGPDLAATPAPLAFELALPSDVPQEDNPYSQRAPEIRPALVERLGGSPETERAVALALAWFARHQSDDGRWDADNFDERCGDCGGEAPRNVKADIAATGLATLCFLGADHTHTRDGPYRDNVARAVQWMLRRQSESGDLRNNETMYSHGIAAIALAEAYGMTHDPALKGPIERAIAFIAEARDSSGDEKGDAERLGGWRYTPHQAGDTSVFGWQVMALASARRAGVQIPDECMLAAASWLRQVTRPERPGLYGYQPGNGPTPSMTAEGLFVQQLLHQAGVDVPDHDDPGTLAAVDFLLKYPPSWAPRSGRGSSGAGGAPTYYWYYATLALFQHQGEQWEKWNDAIKRELLSHQRTGADEAGAAGSWDPVDKYSRVGGRIYQTALCTLTLEVYYRYLPMYQTTGTPTREP